MNSLSECLLDIEWDACLYLYRTGGIKDFGEVVRTFVKVMTEKGYEFKGLDSEGNPREKVSDTNMDRLVRFVLNNEDLPGQVEAAGRGREFLKTVAPELVAYDDETWETMTERLLETEMEFEPGTWPNEKVHAWIETHICSLSHEFEKQKFDADKATDPIFTVKFINNRAFIGALAMADHLKPDFTEEADFRQFLREQTVLDNTGIDAIVQKVRG